MSGATTLVRTDIGIAEEHRQAVVDMLNSLLSDEYVLYTKTRNYHWNVVGMQFNDLHKFFESQYQALDDMVDDIAERARSLGGFATATLAEFLKGTRLKEHPAQRPTARQMIANLLSDHETLIRVLRTEADRCNDTYHDMGTNDFLIGLMEKHEKMAWMLRALTEDGT